MLTVACSQRLLQRTVDRFVRQYALSELLLCTGHKPLISLSLSDHPLKGGASR